MSAEKRYPWYVAGEVCGYKWFVGDGPMPDRATAKKCGKGATVGVPVRVLPNGDAAPCEVAEADGDLLFCEKHWAVVEPEFTGQVWLRKLCHFRRWTSTQTNQT